MDAPNLTKAEIERLAILAEEAGEVVQAVGKVLRHGWESTHPDGGPTNREVLERELGDLIGVQRFLCRAGDLDGARIDVAAMSRVEKMAPYLHHQGEVME